MTKTILPVSFFFGANNKSGYCSLYSKLYNPYETGNHIILKGGPGTGKSTLMKKLATKLYNGGYYVEQGFCSADPNSLDVVLAPEIGFSIFDGTAPHTFDPTMPGVSEHIIDLSVAWDKDYLKKHSEEIGELTKLNKSFHTKVADFLKVASFFESQSVLLCNRFLDREKLERYVLRLASREIPAQKGVEKGKEHTRFLSAVTPDGVVVQHDSVVALAEKIITIHDEYGIAAPYIASYIGDYALENGYDVYKCYCPLFPQFKVEHIIIPQLSLAIFTENNYHQSIDEVSKRIHASRFFLKDESIKHQEKLAFYKKAKKEFVDEAVRKLSLALDTHNRLEEYYIKATDFDVIDKITNKLLKV